MESSQKRKRGRPPKAPPPLLPADQAADLKALLTERIKRRIDGLKLYDPMPLQREFHTSKAKERLIRGANRSGKTTAAAVEFARAVTGQDDRYPKENGIAYLVGFDGKHVANVMYKLLFRAGVFKIIRDEVTNEWRAYHPDKLCDLLRAKEAKHSPPLIPTRIIKSISWENKKENLPKLITLFNGWEIHCFSSNAKPPRGTQIDLCWFDEEISDPEWYSEIAARLVDREGYFFWSATPQAGTAQLFELHERADEQLRLPKEQRTLEEFVSLLSENTHLTDAMKQSLIEKISPEDAMVRIHGEFSSHGMRVFPEFSERTHECPYFEIPPKWTKYAAIDPGRQVCAVLFCAVPTPEDNDDCIYLFDELYIRQCSAEIFGQKMKAKCRFEVEAFIIDHHMGRMTETGSGRTIEDQYSAALDKYLVSCRRTGTEFTWGVADPAAGIEAIREYLAPREGGKPPRLRVLSDRCTNLKWEMKRYWYEKDRDGRVTDKPRDRGPVHLCACLRYIIQDDPIYVEPRVPKAKPGPVFLKAQELMKQGKGNTINLGPGSFTIGVGV
jgi:hypothetical protein